MFVKREDPIRTVIWDFRGWNCSTGVLWLTQPIADLLTLLIGLMQYPGQHRSPYPGSSSSASRQGTWVSLVCTPSWWKATRPDHGFQPFLWCPTCAWDVRFVLTYSCFLCNFISHHLFCRLQASALDPEKIVLPTA